MLRTPPHILVTTPESLYLLLTVGAQPQHAPNRRARSSSTRSTPSSARGAAPTSRCRSSACSRCAEQPLLRIGLSATQKPIEEVARFLVGGDAAPEPCAIVDEGHRRAMDLALEMPRSPLDAVMAHEVWEEYYDRLAELIARAPHDAGVRQHAADGRAAGAAPERPPGRRGGHRAPRQPLEGEAARRRNTAEGRALQALVATASLELGIDIGHVDLVCQIGSPHRIATLLQRVGRSGHTVAGTAEGAAVPDLARRSDRVRGAAALGAPRRARRASSRTTRRSTSWRSRSSPRPPAASTRRTSCSTLVRRALALSRAAARRLRRGRRDAGRGLLDPARPARGAGASRRSEQHGRAAGAAPRMLAHHLGRRDPRGRRLPGRPRARRHVHRHAERGLRHREHGRRRLSARQRVVADAAGGGGHGPRGGCARARRRTFRSGSARRRRGATSCRARSAICAPTSDAAAAQDAPAARPGSRG